MICREIIKEIEARFPKHYAMEWDNVGLQVGRSDKADLSCTGCDG